MLPSKEFEQLFPNILVLLWMLTFPHKIIHPLMLIVRITACSNMLSFLIQGFVQSSHQRSLWPCGVRSGEVMHVSARCFGRQSDNETQFCCWLLQSFCQNYHTSFSLHDSSTVTRFLVQGALKHPHTQQCCLGRTVHLFLCSPNVSSISVTKELLFHLVCPKDALPVSSSSILHSGFKVPPQQKWSFFLVYTLAVHSRLHGSSDGLLWDYDSWLGKVVYFSLGGCPGVFRHISH